jgi:sugar diacid utilization regulator
VLDLPGADGPFFVDDHLDTIIVHRDERLLEALRAQALAPLAGAARGSREAFRQTLRSWLVHMGDRQAVAADLHVHPQTVRYRMGRLQELFGPVLQDPAGRLRLLLALAWDEPAGGSPAAAPAGAADRGRPSRRVHGPHGLRAAVPVRGHR